MQLFLKAFLIASLFLENYSLSCINSTRFLFVNNQNNEYLEKLIMSYAPAIFLDDNNLYRNNNQYDSEKLKQASLREIYNISSYEKELQAKNWLFSGFKPLDGSKVEVFITESWKISPFSIIFNLYNVSKQKLINELKKILISQKHNETHNPQWKIRQFVEQKAQKYWDDIHHHHNFPLMVDNVQVIISFKRLKFENWLKSATQSNTLIIYLKYQRSLNNLKMIVHLSDNKDDEKEQAKNPYKSSTKAVIAGAVILLASILVTMLFPNIISELQVVISNFFMKNWNQIIDEIIDSLPGDNPSDYMINEAINKKFENVLTDEIEETIFTKIKTANQRRFDNQSIMEPIKKIEDATISTMLEDLENLQWPQIPKKDIVDKVVKRLENVQINQKWPQKIEKIKQEVKIKASEGTPELSDFSLANIKKISEKIDQKTSEVLNDELNEPIHELNDEIIPEINNISQNILEQTKKHFSDNFENFLQNYIDKLREEMLNYQAPSFSNKELLMSSNKRTIVWKVLDQKLQTISSQINIKIIDDYLINDVTPKLRQKLLTKFQKSYEIKWLNFHKEINQYKTNIINDDKLKLLILGDCKEFVYKQIWSELNHHHQAIINEKIATRLKKAINNQETNLYQYIKSEKKSLFEPNFFKIYYIYDLNRFFKISVVNPDFSVNHFSKLDYSLRTKLSNLFISSKWYQENVWKNKNARQNIYDLLILKIGQEIEINGQQYYLNSQNFHVEAIIHENQAIVIFLSYLHFPGKMVEIKITLFN